MEQLQFIQTTPQQLEEAIVKGVKIHLDELKKFYEPKSPTEYLSRQETADLLKVDLSTIHNYTKQRKLKSYGIGHRVYYKRAEVEAAIVELKK